MAASPSESQSLPTCLLAMCRASVTSEGPFLPRALPPGGLPDFLCFRRKDQAPRDLFCSRVLVGPTGIFRCSIEGPTQPGAGDPAPVGYSSPWEKAQAANMTPAEGK